MGLLGGLTVLLGCISETDSCMRRRPTLVRSCTDRRTFLCGMKVLQTPLCVSDIDRRLL